jgi:hypothetical protein
MLKKTAVGKSKIYNNTYDLAQTKLEEKRLELMGLIPRSLNKEKKSK